MNTASGLTNSYNIVRENKNPNNDEEWLKTSDEKQREIRLNFILSLQSHIRPYCPDCGEPLTIDDEQIYCRACGLVTQDSTHFNAGIYVHLRHGLRLG